jgi:c-di-GMP-binding flagellar brake protein YcgR
MGYVSDNDEEFAVYDHDVIVSILRGMAKANTPLTGTFNAGADVLLTQILDVDPKADQVYLDVNANEEFNRHILVSKRITFTAFANGAKILWHSAGVKDTRFEGLRAFGLALPERLQRIQRRGAFRVATPMMNPVICKINVKKDHQLTMPLFDICIEGLGLIVPTPPDPSFHRLVEFRDCTIEHPDLGQLEVSLFVKSLWEITLANGSKALRAGLEFTHRDPKVQSKIQKFVYKLERHIIANQKGM